MRLPRDLSGEDLAALLRRRYSYRLVRQQGSHMTLTGTVCGVSHSVTVPRHRTVRVGTAHLGVTQDEVRGRLFGN